MNFQVSGKLWNRSLVMSDVETGSLWSHLLGKAMDGELKGKTLDTVPSVITSWEDWKSIHPETSVMIWPQDKGKQYTTSFFQQKNRNTFGIGYVDGETAKCYSCRKLTLNPLVNDTVANNPILILFDQPTGAAWCYDRTVDDKVLVFESKDDQYFDTETHSSWDLRTGVATDGPMKGTQLNPRVVIPTYESAWRMFHPETET